MSVLRGSHKSLILIARQMGIHIGPNDIPEKYINLNRELMLNELVSLAGTFGMKAKSSKITIENLINLLKKKTTNTETYQWKIHYCFKIY